MSHFALESSVREEEQGSSVASTSNMSKHPPSSVAQRESEIRALLKEKEQLRKELRRVRKSIDTSPVSNSHARTYGQDSAWVSNAIKWLNDGPHLSEISQEEWMHITRSFGLTKARTPVKRYKGFTFNKAPQLSPSEAKRLHAYTSMFTPDQSTPTMHQRHLSAARRRRPNRDIVPHFQAHEFNVYARRAKSEGNAKDQRKTSSGLNWDPNPWVKRQEQREKKLHLERKKRLKALDSKRLRILERNLARRRGKGVSDNSANLFQM